MSDYSDYSEDDEALPPSRVYTGKYWFFNFHKDGLNQLTIVKRLIYPGNESANAVHDLQNQLLRFKSKFNKSNQEKEKLGRRIIDLEG